LVSYRVSAGNLLDLKAVHLDSEFTFAQALYNQRFFLGDID